MKFNTITLCFLIWATAGILSMFVAVIQRLKAKKEHELKTIYMKQFIFLAERGKTSGDILKELHYLFISEKKLRQILVRAMRMPSAKALDYIYSKIGCEPMKIIHGFVLKRECQDRQKPAGRIPNDIVQYFYELIDSWEVDYKEELSQLKRRRIRAFIEIVTFIGINYFLYNMLKTAISMWIFVIVNTLGVILFIVLDSEKKTHSASGLQGLYQLVSGMGLIINIFIVVAGWLGPVA